MEKEQPRFLRVHPLQWVLWQDSRIGRVYTDIEIANNTKIDHIIISFTDCYNAISIDRCPSKPKTEKDLLPFSNFPSCKPEFSSTTKTFVFFFFIKNTKINQSSANDWGKNTKSSFKENVRTSSKKFHHSGKYYNFKAERRLQNLYKKIKLQIGN